MQPFNCAIAIAATPFVMLIGTGCPSSTPVTFSIGEMKSKVIPSYLSKNKKGGLDQILASSTKWIAIAWVLLTLALSLV